jgi:hypothetical protein
MRKFIFGGSYASYSYLLDLYPNATVGYSLRKLRSDYSGASIRVRRSLDNTEQDIGFVGNNLDTASLLAFVGVGNGFVSVWYDQSGAGLNLTQTTASSQPRIVNTGIIDTTNSNNSLVFNGTSNFLQNASVNTGNPKSIFIISQLNNVLGERVMFDSVVTTQAIFYKPVSNFLDIRFGAGIQSLTLFNNNQSLYSILQNGTSSNAYRNSTTQFYTNFNLGTNAFNGFRIGAVRGTAAVFWEGSFQEIIIYGNNQSANRTAIETNINNYYDVY